MKKSMKLPRKRHIIVGAILCFLIFILRVNIVTTLALAFGAGVIQYFSSKYQMRIDTGHVFFLGVLLGQVTDMLTAALFVLIIGITPKMMAGDIDPVILMAYVIQSVFVAASAFFTFPIVLYGIILTLVTFTAVFFMIVAIDFEVAEIIDDTIIPAVINIVLFLTLGDVLLNLLAVLYA